MTISSGQAVELAWDAPGAVTCQLGPPGVEVDAKGTRSVEPATTTTYLLTCRDEDRTKAEARVQVKIQDEVAITDLTANGAAGTTVREGETVTLAWNTRNAQECTITANTVSLEGASYYWFWTIMMFLTAMLFLPVVFLYKSKTYIQDEQ